MSTTLAPSSIIPAEWRGKARVFRDAIAAEDEPTGRMVTLLTTRLTDRIKQRRSAIPRSDVLRGVAAAWQREMPPLSRLSVSIDLHKKSLAIQEARLSSSVYRAVAWGDAEHERGVAIMAISLGIAPFLYQFLTTTIAHVSHHALARRLQRGRGGTEADVLHDLRLLAAAYPALCGRPDGAEFEVPAGDGRWVGTVDLMRDRAAKAPCKSLLTRTFIGGL